MTPAVATSAISRATTTSTSHTTETPLPDPEESDVPDDPGVELRGATVGLVVVGVLDPAAALERARLR
jgi:hypothetical protein